MLAGCLAAGVFAAIMSSLDSQTLAVGTMFTQDIVRHFGFHDRLSEQRQVLFGRLFAMVLLAMAFGFSLITTRSIFSMGIWSLSGFAGLFPIFLAALYWKRSTKTGGRVYRGRNGHFAGGGDGAGVFGGDGCGLLAEPSSGNFGYCKVFPEG